MTKSELLEEFVSRMPTVEERKCLDAAAAVIDSMTQALASGNRIEIRGFGSFGLKYRAERTARNPQNGSSVRVKPRYTVFFKAGKSLRARVDGQLSD